jgi:hypothetical protein
MSIAAEKAFHARHRRRNAPLLLKRGKGGPLCLWRLRVRTNSRVEVPIWTEHYPSVTEGNYITERRVGSNSKAHYQSNINKMMNSIPPDALADLLSPLYLTYISTA